MANNNNMEAKKGTNFTELDDKALETVTGGEIGIDAEAEKKLKEINEALIKQYGSLEALEEKFINANQSQAVKSLIDLEKKTAQNNPSNTGGSLTDSGFVLLNDEISKIIK